MVFGVLFCIPLHVRYPSIYIMELPAFSLISCSLFNSGMERLTENFLLVFSLVIAVGLPEYCHQGL